MPESRLGRESSWDQEESRSFFRRLLGRSWYIFIPLLGVWFFHIRTLTPQVQAIDHAITEDRRVVEEQRNATLKEARKMGVQISRLHAFKDTLEVRHGQMSSLLDSVRVIQMGHREETRMLEAQIDSLRRVLSEAEGQSMQFSDALQSFQTAVDSLREKIGRHRDEIQRLEVETERTRDLTDRIQYPDKYRRNDALVVGRGEFPNRDALPKR